MTDTEIVSALKQLEKTLGELKTHIAWQKLKQAEARPGEPPGFNIGDTVEDDMRHCCSAFLAQQLELRHKLWNADGKDISQRKKADYQRQLANLQSQFRQLDIPQTCVRQTAFSTS